MAVYQGYADTRYSDIGKNAGQGMTRAVQDNLQEQQRNRMLQEQDARMRGRMNLQNTNAMQRQDHQLRMQDQMRRQMGDDVYGFSPQVPMADGQASMFQPGSSGMMDEAQANMMKSQYLTGVNPMAYAAKPDKYSFHSGQVLNERTGQLTGAAKSDDEYTVDKFGRVLNKTTGTLKGDPISDDGKLSTVERLQTERKKYQKGSKEYGNLTNAIIKANHIAKSGSGSGATSMEGKREIQLQKNLVQIEQKRAAIMSGQGNYFSDPGAKEAALAKLDEYENIYKTELSNHSPTAYKAKYGDVETPEASVVAPEAQATGGSWRDFL